MFKLRPYQEKAVQDCINYLNSNSYSKVAVVAPVAAGKSLIIATIADYIKTPVVVIQPSKELLMQNLEKYTSFGGEASVFSNSLKSKKISHTTFATIGSIISHVDKFRELGVTTVLIDEMHYNCATDSRIHKFIKAMGAKTKVIGFTASPIILTTGEFGSELKMVNRTNKSMFSDIIHVTQINEIKDEFWSPINYNIFTVKNKNALIKNSNGSDYTEESLTKYYIENNIKEQTISLLSEIKDKERSILIFAPSIESAEDLSRSIKDSRVVTSNTPKEIRDLILRDFKNNELQIVINVNILSMGFDMPSLTSVIELRPTMSMAIYYQHLGRVVRPYEAKIASIYDFSGNYDKFGKIEDISFENIEGYGWGMFNKDRVLTNIPMGVIQYKADLVKNINNDTPQGVKFHWGKYNGRLVSEIIQKDGQYISWLLSQQEFNWSGKRNQDIKNEIDFAMSKYINR